MLEGLFIGDMYGASRRDSLKNNVREVSSAVEHHTHTGGGTVIAPVLSDGNYPVHAQEFEYMQLDIDDSPHEDIAKWFPSSIQ